MPKCFQENINLLKTKKFCSMSDKEYYDEE